MDVSHSPRKTGRWLIIVGVLSLYGSQGWAATEVMTLLDGENFWGVAATDFVLAYLDDPSILATDAMRHAASLPAAAERRR